MTVLFSSRFVFKRLHFKALPLQVNNYVPDLIAITSPFVGMVKVAGDDDLRQQIDPTGYTQSVQRQWAMLQWLMISLLEPRVHNGMHLGCCDTRHRFVCPKIKHR